MGEATGQVRKGCVLGSAGQSLNTISQRRLRSVRKAGLQKARGMVLSLRTETKGCGRPLGWGVTHSFAVVTGLELSGLITDLPSRWPEAQDPSKVVSHSTSQKPGGWCQVHLF